MEQSQIGPKGVGVGTTESKNTEEILWGRVHSLREWGRVKQKLCKPACLIFAFFCQSHLDGII